MKKLFNISVAALLCISLFAGCKEQQKDVPYSERMVESVYIATDLVVQQGQQIGVQGIGFLSSDVLVFEAEDHSVEIGFDAVTYNYALFTVTEELERGSYLLHLRRGERFQKLCQVKVYMFSEFNVPDHEGYNIKGIVFEGTTGIPGVLVSDGKSTTVTDENGFYWLQCDKVMPTVFITTPSGYVPATGTKAAPGFWQHFLSPDPDVPEQLNFQLERADQSSVTLLFGADTHLAGRDASNRDMTQFEKGFMTELREFTAMSGVDKTYLFILGDGTWDKYWYVQRYGPADFRRTMEASPVPMYTMAGNHDNDPYVQGDFASQHTFSEVFGPVYYSINISGVHVIVLDTVIYINTGGKDGTVGDRNFSKYLNADQINWLKADLDAIEDKNTPVIVLTHCPPYTNYNSKFSKSTSWSSESKTSDFVEMFKDFQNVRMFCGHVHTQTNLDIKPTFRLTHVAAVSECWWWGGKYSGRSVCADGTPAGYQVLDISGRQINDYYKGIGCPREEQFRTYDMNVVKEYLKEYVGVLNKQYDSARDTKGDDYGSLGNNIVYINVFDYDPSWTIEVTENAVTPLKVTRVYDRDPLHTITYDIPRVENGGSLTSSNASTRNAHMFSVQCTSATSRLDIKVTDDMGNVFSEQMTRPKAYNVSMK